MPKRKNFNRRALSCISTRTHLEGRRSVELMDLRFKPVRGSRVQGFQGPYGGSQLVLTLYRIYIFCFQMCNRLPELMKNGDAGIFPVYYNRNLASNILSPSFGGTFLFDDRRPWYLLPHRTLHPWYWALMGGTCPAGDFPTSNVGLFRS